MKRLSTQHTIGELARAVEWAYPPSGTTSVRGCCRNRTGLLPAIAFIATRLWPGCASFGGHSNSASRWRKSRVCWSCADVRSRANRYGGFLGNQLLRYDHPTTRGVHPHNYRASIESGLFAHVSSIRSHAARSRLVRVQSSASTHPLALSLALLLAQFEPDFPR